MADKSKSQEPSQMIYDWKTEARELERDTKAFNDWLQPNLEEFVRMRRSAGRGEVEETGSSFAAKDLEGFTEMSPGAYLEDRDSILVERYGSPEGAERAIKAIDEQSQQLREERPHGSESWEAGPDYKALQDAGDVIGWIPHPTAQVVGSTAYTLGAALGGRLNEAVGGAVGFRLGRAARPLAAKIRASKKYQDLVLKHGPITADVIASQAVQELGEVMAKTDQTLMENMRQK